MNTYIKAQISNMCIVANTFVQACELATKMDDNFTDKKESKELSKIKKLTEEFIKELQKIK
jgi:hypothetical protein